MKSKNLIALLVGQDSVSKRLASDLASDCERDSLRVIEDCTTNMSRIWRLIYKRRISPAWLVQQAYARIRQASYLAERPPITVDHRIYSNAALSTYLSELNIQHLLAFRAGLIIKCELLTQISCFNVHCATLPKYAGLCSISRALKDKAFHQHAVVHRIVERIDEGSVIVQHNYQLDPDNSYWKNDLAAYQAGVVAGKAFLESLKASSFSRHTAATDNSGGGC